MFDRSKPFYYNIGGMQFNLEELKHGVLRGNKKPPGAFMRSLSGGDSRAVILSNFSDPRINFVCPDFPELAEHIDCFTSPEDLDEKLN